MFASYRAGDEVSWEDMATLWMATHRLCASVLQKADIIIWTVVGIFKPAFCVNVQPGSDDN
jgi:hypothetical protein